MTQLIDLVGNTPLIEISHPNKDCVRVFGKCEWYNPSGSVKDRAAANMVQEALKEGALDGKILIDATSGNTGIAYAMIGAALNIPVELALPENASEERKLILKNYGVNLHLTSAMEGTDGAQRTVKKLLKTILTSIFIQTNTIIAIIGRHISIIQAQKFGLKQTNLLHILYRD